MNKTGQDYWESTGRREHAQLGIVAYYNIVQPGPAFPSRANRTIVAAIGFFAPTRKMQGGHHGNLSPRHNDS